MTIPSRPAPAPPPPGSNGNPHRYTPTTDWDDRPFENAAVQKSSAASGIYKKVPPPRPPPPKANPTAGGAGFQALKKSSQPPQSINILSNLFGTKRSKTPPTNLAPPPSKVHLNRTNKFNHNKNVPMLPPPPASSSVLMSHQSAKRTGAELIDFNSPPSSPTLTHKTCSFSDCMSVDSFSSDTNSNSSPQNGNWSQTESGFEDDFSSSAGAMGGSSRSSSATGGIERGWSVKDLAKQMTLVDPFSAPPVKQDHSAKIRPLPPPIVAQKPKVVNQSAFYSQNAVSFQPAKHFDDPLNNGKCLIQPAPILTMPTIIKPVIKAKPSVLPKPKMAKSEITREELEGSPSPPMPNCPPPPPPPEYFEIKKREPDSVSPICGEPIYDQVNEQIYEELNDYDEIQAEEEPVESYGIALYDFESDQDGDLNFRENDKIYLVKQLNEEWMFGRSKRGCEGMFPINYVDIKVPLKAEKKLADANTAAKKSSNSKLRTCKALYDFEAETPDDLTIKEGDIITVQKELNAEWLQGYIGLRQGQFPANYVEFL